ncbi:hypothetical protein WA026_002970 [Henosepilachna vigintioctopunctata]|uniref:Cyclic nucleotide-binding domain-containing protein n=1 Tax=Henosepilachna vigintioctopunctata TaxID=420089 RepID=A0AAW1TL51_9CUCU
MEDQKEERQIRRVVKIRRIFKSCIRLAYFNAYWLMDEGWRDSGPSFMKNIRVLVIKKKSRSLVTFQQKAILNKPEEDRTEEERRYLSNVFEGMRCFKRYPEETRRRLAAVAAFAYFPPKRYVLRTGDPPYGWYYILDGKVSIRRKGETGVKEIQIYEKGYTFGEIDLLYDKPRSRSVITLTHCEFLVIQKEHFDSIIKDTVMRHYSIITSHMKQLPYFDQYSDEDYLEACLVGKVKEFEHDELVLGDDVGYSQFTYFIVKGNINIIHHLMFKTAWNEKRQKYDYKIYDPFEDPKNPYFVKKLDSVEVPDTGMDKEKDVKYVWDTPPPVVDYFQMEMVKKLPDDIHTCFVRIYKLTETACFNIGEHLKHRFAVAETISNCVCLLLPRNWLYKRNTSFFWSRLTEFLNKRIPSDKLILCEYVRMRKWEIEKKEMISKLLSKSNRPQCNSIHNVPYSLRLRSNIAYNEQPCPTSSKKTRRPSRL